MLALLAIIPRMLALLAIIPSVWFFLRRAAASSRGGGGRRQVTSTGGLIVSVVRNGESGTVSAAVGLRQRLFWFGPGQRNRTEADARRAAADWAADSAGRIVSVVCNGESGAVSAAVGLRQRLFWFGPGQRNRTEADARRAAADWVGRLNPAPAAAPPRFR